MNCKSYIELTSIERAELVQRLAHLVQTDETMFKALSSIVRQAENNGLLNGLTVLPQNFIVVEDLKDI
jgi:hypothetical protein